MWYELFRIMENVNLVVEEKDQLIWSFSSNGKFSVQSLYVVTNHRGVTSVHVHTVWKLKVPPRVHILWLLLKNKMLTRDNLTKRRDVSYQTCILCNESEYIDHLFFECCGARRIWSVVAEILNLRGD